MCTVGLSQYVPNDMHIDPHGYLQPYIYYYIEEDLEEGGERELLCCCWLEVRDGILLT